MSNFDFSNVRLWDLDIPREKWLNCLQTMETLIRRRILRRLIWVFTVCQLPFYFLGRTQNEFESATVNELSVFELLKFYYIIKERDGIHYID